MVDEKVLDATSVQQVPRSQTITFAGPSIRPNVGGSTTAGNPQSIILYRTLSIRIEETQRSDFKKLTPSIKESFWNFFSRGKKTAGPTADEELAGLDFHKVEPSELFQRFNTTEKLGLDSVAAKSRLDRNGKNVMSRASSNLPKKIFNYLFGGFAGILWLAGVLACLSWKPIGEPDPQAINLYIGCVIFLVIVIQIIFTVWQDYTTSQVMKSIHSMLPANCIVLRDGEKKQIAASDLVIGDVVVLSLGIKVPADLRLVEVSNDLKFDRSILTGESDAIPGTVAMTDNNYLETKNIAFMSTHCTQGSGLGIVVSTGDKTVLGKISKLTSAKDDETTLLQQEIHSFIVKVAFFSITLGIILIAVWAAWLQKYHYGFMNASGIIIVVLALIVAFVPEGVPVAVAITLNIIARRMQRSNVLCKVLTTVETLGSVSVICSDKTGTLTENRMTVKTIAFAHHQIEIDNYGDIKSEAQEASSAVRKLQLAAALNCAAGFAAGQEEKPINDRETVGDATDSAILKFAESLGSVQTEQDAFEEVFKIPFNSKNKWMLTLRKPISESAIKEIGVDTLVLYVKGAPDILFPRCTSYIDKNGDVQSLTPEARAAINSSQEQLSGKGQRVLALCSRNIVLPSKVLSLDQDAEDFARNVEIANAELTIVGLVGIVDPPRKEIPGVVSTVRRAGCRVVMVTGDFSITATAIAKQCGIITVNNVDNAAVVRDPSKVPTHRDDEDEETFYNNNITALVITGSDLLEGFSDHEWDVICSYSEIVFARTTPEQKLRIVNEMRTRGAIVGVTGDGVNDAPALKAAHIGIAMGAGSDVAIAAADMVLLDNNFSSILVAMENGRLVFDNLKKVIIYLLPAGSWSELWPVLWNIFLGIPAPLSSFLMIIICIFTDLAPSCLGMVFEGPESDLMLRRPRNPKKEKLVSWSLFGQAYLFMGMMEMICAHSMFFFYMYKYANIPLYRLAYCYENWTDGFMGHTMDELNHFVSVGQCVYFVTLVIMQLFGNLFASRTRRLSVLQKNPFWGPSKNWRIPIAMCISIAIVAFVLYVPFFNNTFQTAPIPLEFWFIPIPLAIGMLLMDEIRKLLVRTYPKSFIAKVAW
ncbi:K, P-type ATPase [Umbelopsis sp. PMI_123]|nr:K, P-type ATPase [Umbelopsis sp. PMI_123]